MKQRNPPALCPQSGSLDFPPPRADICALFSRAGAAFDSPPCLQGVTQGWAHSKDPLTEWGEKQRPWAGQIPDQSMAPPCLDFQKHPVLISRASSNGLFQVPDATLNSCLPPNLYPLFETLILTTKATLEVCFVPGVGPLPVDSTSWLVIWLLKGHWPLCTQVAMPCSASLPDSCHQGACQALRGAHCREDRCLPPTHQDCVSWCHWHNSGGPLGSEDKECSNLTANEQTSRKGGNLKLRDLHTTSGTPSSTLAWKIPRTEEPGGPQSMGSLRVRHDWATSLSLFTFMHWRRKWQPTPVFLPGESQARGSLVGCRLWGSTELDTTEET